jgi:hypothetical protein
MFIVDVCALERMLFYLRQFPVVCEMVNEKLKLFHAIYFRTALTLSERASV